MNAKLFTVKTTVDEWVQTFIESIVSVYTMYVILIIKL
jgi:hypothetical protein